MKMIHRLALAATAVGLISFASTAHARPPQEPPALRPTVVLVHGAFAESASWNAVARRLRARSYPVIAVANPLRGVKSDAAQVSALVASVKGPVVLVGHSYGGSVISAAADGMPNVKALVFVAAFAPEAGESAFDLSGKVALGDALAPPVELPDGAKDLYIQQDKFGAQFAADVPADDARLMAVAQRPITDRALAEGAPAAAWKNVPSWFVFGDRDRNISPQALAFMAQRAHSRKTVVIKGGSHVVMISKPDAVSHLIIDAANAITGAASHDAAE